MNIEELIEKADEFNRKEIRKYYPDFEFLYDISVEAGLRLAKHYGANETIVRIALAMMDSKLYEAKHLGKAKEHVKMSSDATKDLLKDIDFISYNDKENIIKSVEQHHSKDGFYSIEAEVAANADCYKFIHPKGVIFYISEEGRALHDFEKELIQVEKKLNEKHDILSLPLAKEELESYYQMFHILINDAKK